MEDFLNSSLGTAVIVVPPLLVAVVLHEIAHGVAAEKLGDPTARQRGRLTLNPIVHIDLFMTIILPAMLILSKSPVVFGGAKPIPVDTRNLKNPKRDMALVAVAGPVTNIILLIISYLLFLGTKQIAWFLPDAVALISLNMLAYSVIINLVLALFNLFPVPPLDGGRIAVGLLPQSLAVKLAKLEPYGIMIVFLMLFSGVIDGVLGPAVRFVLRMLG